MTTPEQWTNLNFANYSTAEAAHLNMNLASAGGQLFDALSYCQDFEASEKISRAFVLIQNAARINDQQYRK